MRGGMGPGCTAKGITAPGAAGEQPQSVLALGVLLQPLRTMPIRLRVASGTSNRCMGLHPFLEQVEGADHPCLGHRAAESFLRDLLVAAAGDSCWVCCYIRLWNPVA